MNRYQKISELYKAASDDSWKNIWGLLKDNEESVPEQFDEKYVEEHITSSNTWQEYLSKTPDDKSRGAAVEPEDVKATYESWAKQFGYDNQYSTFKKLYNKRLTTAPSSDIKGGIILPSRYLEILKNEASKGKSSLSTNPDDIPESIGFKETGEYTLPYFSFNSVPCESCANLALKESEEKGDNGNISEKDPEAAPMILKYFNFTSENNAWKKKYWKVAGREGCKRKK